MAETFQGTLCLRPSPSSCTPSASICSLLTSNSVAVVGKSNLPVCLRRAFMLSGSISVAAFSNCSLWGRDASFIDSLGSSYIARRRSERKRSTSIQVQAAAGPNDGVKWWEKDGGPNMMDVHSSQELADAVAAAGDKLVVVEYFATWCGSCRALYPKLCKIAAEHTDIVFLKVNFDDNKPLCKSLNIRVLPYFHFYRGADGLLDAFSCSISKDKLDGTNFSLWSFMIKNILVAKGLWEITSGDDERPISVQPATPQRTGTSTQAALAVVPLTEDQKKGDRRDAQVMSVIAMSIKRSILPHISSCKTSKSAWDTLSKMYLVKNVARVFFLRNQLMHLKMQEEDLVTEHLTKIKDLKEQLLNIDEVIEDDQLVSITLNSLSSSFLTFVTSLSISLMGSKITFDELVGLLLQEEQTRKNFSNASSSSDQTFVVKGKGKAKTKQAFVANKKPFGNPNKKWKHNSSPPP